MNKKVLSLVLALAIVLGSFGTVALASNVEYNSQEQKIQWLIDNEHVVGRKVNEDGSADLALEDNVTRAEITKLLVHILGKTDLAEVLDGVMRPFPDVTVDHWANGFISVATTTRSNDLNDNRIVIGYPDGNFYPENNVTYAELATMLVRIVKDDLTTRMEDNSIWATSYMRWADEEGILEGLEIANSDRAIPRADAFEMIYNAFFNMGQINDVDFGDDLGIVSRLGNGEIQLNQDADKVYDIDSNTLLTDGTAWTSLLANIDGVNRGSLVRLIVDGDGNVTHLIELGNPRELAIGEEYSLPLANIEDNVRWHGVADHTAEGDAEFTVVNRRYLDLEVNGVTAEINNSTRFFVADVENNALKEVESVGEAFTLFGIEDEDIERVYMGYDEDDDDKEEAGNIYNTAKVIVFNKVENYFGDKEVVRVTGDLNSLYRFQAENTKGVKKVYDVSNLPLFPSNDLLDAMDVVEITDNTNVQYARDLIKIDYSEDPVFRVKDAGTRSLVLVDKDGYERTFRVARDAKVFVEGQLKDGVHVQIDMKDGEITIVSVVDKALKGIISDGIRVGTDSGYVTKVIGRTVTVADSRDGRLVNHRSFIIAETDVAFFNNWNLEANRARKIVFDVADKFGDTDYMYNVELVSDQATTDVARARAAIQNYLNTGEGLARAQELVNRIVNNNDRATVQSELNDAKTKVEDAIKATEDFLALENPTLADKEAALTIVRSLPENTPLRDRLGAQIHAVEVPGEDDDDEEEVDEEEALLNDMRAFIGTINDPLALDPAPANEADLKERLEAYLGTLTSEFDVQVDVTEFNVEDGSATVDISLSEEGADDFKGPWTRNIEWTPAQGEEVLEGEAIDPEKTKYAIYKIDGHNVISVEPTLKGGKNFSELETFAATVMEDNLELATNTLTNKNINQDHTSTGVYNFNRVSGSWITEVHVDTETWTDEYVPNQVKYTYTIDGIKYEQILDITSWYYGGQHLPE